MYGRNVLALERKIHHNWTWGHSVKPHLLIKCLDTLSHPSLTSSSILAAMVFTSPIGSGYAHLDHQLQSMPETIEHKILRSRKAKTSDVPELIFKSRPTQTLSTVWTNVPQLLIHSMIKVLKTFLFLVFLTYLLAIYFQVSCRGSPVVCSDRSAAYWLNEFGRFRTREEEQLLLHGFADSHDDGFLLFQPSFPGGLEATKPLQGWSNVVLPGRIFCCVYHVLCYVFLIKLLFYLFVLLDKETLICDAGKLQVLDTLLRRLKSEGHRVLIYSQMTRIIDLLEVILNIFSLNHSLTNVIIALGIHVASQMDLHAIRWLI